MKLSQKAASQIDDAKFEQKLSRIHKKPNRRKLGFYWIGFLQGVLASSRIEKGEDIAIYEEAKRFSKIIKEPNIDDLLEDIEDNCFDSERDLIDSLNFIIEEKRKDLLSEEAASEREYVSEFLGFCAGIICDGKVLRSEVIAIHQRFSNSEILSEFKILESLRNSVTNSLHSTFAKQNQYSDIQEWIGELVGNGYHDTGVPNLGNVTQIKHAFTNPKAISFYGKTFVLTGTMTFGTRTIVQDMIKEKGGTCAKTVSNKTDFVVVASAPSEHWLTTHFGTKIKKAHDLISKGSDLKIVTEYALEKALQTN